MTDQFVGEIRAFPFNFLPRGWLWCDGQLLPISQNTALFSILGTNYGGDGKATFGLPDLRGRVPMQHGHGPGMSQYDLGDQVGSERVALLEAEMPAHSHAVLSSTADAVSRVPSNARVLAEPASGAVHAPPGATVWASEQSINPAGGGQPHNNMQPYLTLSFAIAAHGIFPQRSEF